MKKRMHILILMALLVCVYSFAQDKLILKNGEKIKCKIISINISTIDYKDSTSAIYTLEKQEILMAELKNGDIHIFGNETNRYNSQPRNRYTRELDKKAAIREKEKDFKDNIYGFQPIDIVWGRLTFTYERLLYDKKIGVAVPFSLTFDPRVLIPDSSNDTLVNTREKVRHNVGFITGLDLNYYYESKSHTKFFFGPRFRYGTDVNLANITAYTLQFQQGFLLCDSKGKMATTLAFGFGFARIISTPFSSAFQLKQSFPWASFTLRLGIRR